MVVPQPEAKPPKFFCFVLLYSSTPISMIFFFFYMPNSDLSLRFPLRPPGKVLYAY